MAPQTPFPRVGLSHRRELDADIRVHAAQIDVLEVIAEKYFDAGPAELERLDALAERFTLVPHGLTLSVGSAGRVCPRMLESIRQLCERVRAPWYSDHLALSSAPGIDIGHLSPIAYHRTSLRHAAARIHAVQDATGLPFVIENITETHAVPGGTQALPEFLHALVDATGCGLLLDITNLAINCINAGIDPLREALAMPLDAVVQVHLAGGKWRRGRLLDTHSAPVPEPVWQLLAALRPRLRHLQAVVIERDAEYPPFPDLLAEIQRARLALRPARTATPDSPAQAGTEISESSEMCAA